MDGNRLFTIGHSNRSSDEFLSLLKESEISAIADVRSHPYSARNPHFNREVLTETLQQNGIEYVFLGDELGARRSEPECYEDGKAKYELIAKSPLFKSGLDRILSGLQKHHIALMCAERDPLTCHRMILICRNMPSREQVKHILDENQIENHQNAERRLLKLAGLSLDDLFHSVDEQIDHAYDIQADKIAYCDKTEVISAEAGGGGEQP